MPPDKQHLLEHFLTVCFVSATQRVTGIENQLLSGSPAESAHADRHRQALHAVHCLAGRDREEAAGR